MSKYNATNRLSLAWFKGCVTDEDKKNREALVRNSVAISDLLLAVLHDKYMTIERKGFKEEDYATAGWPTLHAFRNGKMAAFEEIAELFNHLTKEYKTND